MTIGNFLEKYPKYTKTFAGFVDKNNFIGIGFAGAVIQDSQATSFIHQIKVLSETFEKGFIFDEFFCIPYNNLKDLSEIAPVFIYYLSDTKYIIHKIEDGILFEVQEGLV